LLCDFNVSHRPTASVLRNLPHWLTQYPSFEKTIECRAADSELGVHSRIGQMLTWIPSSTRIQVSHGAELFSKNSLKQANRSQAAILCKQRQEGKNIINLLLEHLIPY
jgi:hypothetical protein